MPILSIHWQVRGGLSITIDFILRISRPCSNSEEFEILILALIPLYMKICICVDSPKFSFHTKNTNSFNDRFEVCDITDGILWTTKGILKKTKHRRNKPNVLGGTDGN